MSEDEHGGFSAVRESADGNPMAGLLGYCKPYWPRLSVGLLAALLTRASRLVPPLLVAAALNRVITTDGEPGMLADAGLLPSGTISGQAARMALLEQLVVVAALAYVVRSVTRFASRYLFQSTAQKVQRDLRDDTYDHMQHLSLDFFANHQTGAMMSVLNQDVNRLEQFLNTEIRQAIRVVATVGGIGIIMFYHSPELALIALAPVPVIGLASWKFLSWIEPRYRGIRETVSRLNSRLENNIGGARVIKAFNRHGFELDRVAEQSDRYHAEKVGAIRLRRAFFSVLRLMTGVVFVAVLWVAGSDIIRYGMGNADPRTVGAGAFALFFLLLRRLYSPMRRVGKTANKYQLAKSSAERVFGILGHEPQVTSPPDAYVPESVEGSVTFDDVRFGYTDDEEVLSGVSLDVEAGETVGLAGTTGAGKSTLLKLIPRFYDVNAGAVEVDGTDVREYDLTALREHVGIVEQNPYMFSGSAAENIAYGDLSALDEGTEAGDGEGGPGRRIVEAAKAAEAHEFITDLPEGYDTQIGERGVKLSGGQRQRVAIARALLNDPEVIILDEATSDVDTETEELIQESLRSLTADRTAFVIAHRLSTIRDADRVVVLDDGRVDEVGSHAELVAEGGAYADLWARQAGDEAGAPADD
ncbi:ABC transporter ATP-binding protein [Candidatus Halobonum tyrrellensis]|uniref:ABC transporter ATP-binding protein n=1 Tax=Candidatus Halobonum tyrrellensis G22 TaxID=1324957 RepID=V4HAL4_9EURY|nr:ABC transporter ATP-binding protein [Candidatus Halobonum tyrrellensis]ESP87745.1 ABC transporter ATP-binding protein [Candidatus Halobonum tyrrellensis G22]